MLDEISRQAGAWRRWKATQPPEPLPRARGLCGGVRVDIRRIPGGWVVTRGRTKDTIGVYSQYHLAREAAEEKFGPPAAGWKVE